MDMYKYLTTKIGEVCIFICNSGSYMGKVQNVFDDFVLIKDGVVLNKETWTEPIYKFVVNVSIPFTAINVCFNDVWMTPVIEKQYKSNQESLN